MQRGITRLLLSASLILSLSLSGLAQSPGAGLTLTVSAPADITLSRALYGPSKGYTITALASDPGGVSSITLSSSFGSATGQAGGAKSFTEGIVVYPYYYSGNHNVFVQANGAHGTQTANVMVHIVP